MLYQIVVNWDDISAFTANTSLTPVTIIKPINLYDGAFKGKIVGFTYLDNKANAVAADNQTLVNISSSRFSFPASAQQGVWFTNRMEHVDPHIKGHHDFVINNIAGNIDINIIVQQFNVDRTKNNAGTWNNTGFLSLILTLDIEKIEQQ